MSSTRFGKAPDPVITKDWKSHENSLIESRRNPYNGCLIDAYSYSTAVKTSNGVESS